MWFNLFYSVCAELTYVWAAATLVLVLDERFEARRRPVPLVVFMALKYPALVCIVGFPVFALIHTRDPATLLVCAGLTGVDTAFWWWAHRHFRDDHWWKRRAGTAAGHIRRRFARLVVTPEAS